MKALLLPRAESCRRASAPVGKKLVLAILGLVTLGAGVTVAGENARLRVSDTSSPRDTLRSFIEASNEVHARIEESWSLDRNTSEARGLAQRIMDCLDTRDLPGFAREQRAAEIAAALKEIIDRVDLPAWEEIPDAAQIEAAGGFEKLSRWRIPDTRITIERVEEGVQKHEYLFSRGSLSRAVNYYERLAHLPYRTDGPAVSPGLYEWLLSAPGHPAVGAIVKWMPDSMRKGRTLGLANWKWPGLLLLLGFAILAMCVLYSLQLSFGKRLANRSVAARCLAMAFPIAAMLVPVVVQSIAEDYLTLRATPLYITRFTSTMVLMLASAVAIFTVSRRVSEIIIATPWINEKGLNAQMVRVGSQILGLLAAFAIVTAGGQHLGIPVATLLASAGIGGLAVALAAQDTLKTLFATVTIMADRPCRVGDRILIDNLEGDVEDIGLRSTKLRLLDGQLVALSNDKIASQELRNISRRNNIGGHAEIQMPRSTSCDDVEKAVRTIHKVLEEDEGMDPVKRPKVFFDELGPQSFRIRFYYWYGSTELWEYRAWNSALNLKICRALEAEEIQLS